ncbi:MAG: ABC transporter ATP-binding protein [Clostridia bacterium]|nr:ABC transporter ATP-binding protein [Clostridia bacterium]
MTGHPAREEEKTLIEVRNLTKVYGDHVAVNDLSFTIEQGKIYGFLGPNGAGKTTTMNMITGCLAPTAGEVLIDGADIFVDAVKAKKHIGYLPEIPPVYPDMTPLEYLKFVGRAKGIRAADLTEKVFDVMEETGITDMRDRLIKHLSKGYRQRVGIAQAMLGDPELIILDEPTVGLDPRQIIEIRELISELGKTRTIILSSHILAEVQAVCDHVMILNEGRLVASDTLENIRKDNTPENAVLLTVRSNPESIKKTVESVPGVTGCDIVPGKGDNLYDVRVEAEEGADLTESLFRAFASGGFAVLRLTREEPSLEEVFIRLTEHYSRSDGDDSAEKDPGEDGVVGENEDEKGEDEDEDGDDYSPLFGGRRED